jgi:hypothetical protein
MATMAISMIVMAALAPLATPVAPPQRLTDEQVEQVLAAAAAKREAVEAASPPPKLDIHGEVGVTIGTGGYEVVYGSAFVPLGDDGAAIVALSSETRPYRRRTRARR